MISAAIRQSDHEPRAHKLPKLPILYYTAFYGFHKRNPSVSDISSERICLFEMGISSFPKFYFGFTAQPPNRTFMTYPSRPRHRLVR